MGKFTENRERTLTQDEFIRRLSGSTGLTYEQAQENVLNIKMELTSCMLDGLCVKWRGFGTFGVFKQKGRVIKHSIFTREKQKTADQFVVKFRAGKRLNKLVNHVLGVVS